MNICNFFIARPVMTTLLMCALFVFGVLGYFALPVSDLPNVEYPTIQVNAHLTGANPETVASTVAVPLERQFSTIPGVVMMTSESTLGKVSITLQFALEKNIDGAAADVQAALNVASHNLPKDMTDLPTFRKINPAAAPILYIALHSPTVPIFEVNRYAEALLAQRIAMLQGVAEVSVYGAQKYAVRIQLNPHALVARNISIEEITQAIANANSHTPTGVLNTQQQSFLIQTNAEFQDAVAFKKLIIAFRKGAPIHLRDVATVVDSVENTKTASWYNGERAIILAVQKQPGSNTIAVIDQIKKLLPDFQQQLPKGLRLNVVFDRSLSIRQSVAEVKHTLLIAALLVVLVIFLFIRNFKLTFIPALALPLSIFGTFGFMHYLGFSINNLTLLALTLVVGFVIDDAIVMLENIVRHVENGSSAVKAAVQGSREIAFTILSMTLSLVAVFIPIIFMPGIIGRLFHEFSVTICIAILVSCFVSLTLTPMLCRWMLQSHPTAELPWMRWSARLFNRIQKKYEQSLSGCLRYRRTTLSLLFVTIVLTGMFFYLLPKGFLPNEDTSQLMAYTEGDTAASFETMVAAQQKVSQLVAQHSQVAALISSVGSGGVGSAGNSGHLFIRLKPRNSRSISADEIADNLKAELIKIPGIKVFLQNILTLRIGAKSSKSPYQVMLEGNDFDALIKYSELLKNKMQHVPAITDVTSDLQYTGPQINVDIDTDKAAILGVSVKQIKEVLYDVFGTRQIETIYMPDDTYAVMMELKPTYIHDQNALLMLRVRNAQGNLIPLSSMVSLHESVGPQSITHVGTIPAITLSFALKPGVALGEALQQIEALQNEISLPKSLSLHFQGTAKIFQSSLHGLSFMLLIAIFVIYIILGMLYESFIHPLTILSGLPAAGLGALATLFLFHAELNLYAFIGIIMLIGIVKKNAIIMIDFALTAKKQGLSPHIAVYQACTIRFRPIMMTTMAALLGTLPIALSLDSNGKRVLGLCVVGGLVVSQLLTLYITPVIYLYFETIFSRRNFSLKRKIYEPGRNEETSGSTI